MQCFIQTPRIKANLESQVGLPWRLSKILEGIIIMEMWSESTLPLCDISSSIVMTLLLCGPFINQQLIRWPPQFLGSSPS